MKSTRLIIILAIVLFSISLLAAETQQWRNYLAEYKIRSMAEFEGTIWLGTNNGLIQVDAVTGEKTHYDIYNSGLPDNNIYSLAITDEGVLWLATQYEGVVMYDGEQWTVFDESNSGLPDSAVRSITIDDSGGIWFGTVWGGAVYYDGEEWMIYTPANSGLPHLMVNHIFIDSNGDKWFATSAGIAYFDDEEWIVYSVENTPMEGKSFRYITECNDNLIWIGTSAELASFDREDGWQIYNMQTTGLPLGGMKLIAIDQANTKWIPTDFGLISYDDQNWTVYNKENSGIPDDKCFLVIVDDSDKLWMSVTVSEQYTDKLVGFDGYDWDVINIANSGLFPYGQILLQIDDDGVIWVPFSIYYDEEYIAGITSFDGQEWNHHFAPQYFNMISFMIDADNNKWIGTSQGLFFYDGNQWTVYNTSNSGLHHNKVNAIARDHQGDMWIGTEAGLAHFDGEEWIAYTYFNSPLPHPKVTAIAIDQNGDKWIGTGRSSTLGGVVHFDGENWTVYDASNSDYPASATNTIAIDSNNDKWFGTYQGLVHFDDEEWTIYHEGNSAIPHNVVRDIVFDQNNDIWLSLLWTGVTKFDGTNWEFYNYLNSPIGVPFEIAIDQHENIWITNALSLVVYNEGGIVSADEWEIFVPKSEIVSYNYPNPFNPATTIAYDLPQEGSVKIEIFNIRGQKVKTLVDTHKQAGKHQVVWNGKDEYDNTMPSGIYLYQINMRDKTVSGKMMMVK